ncbi:MAG TPA: metallophosphoesterase family protein [Balneolales bacterium]|nr:metallophosphoesterase family protein [Balneolales bacterium]
MQEKKFIAVGDIHGCAKTLELMLDELDEYDQRVFIFMGDYIDRGPDSCKVIDLLLEFEEDHECIWLRGNHEQMLLDALDGGDYSVWLYNGGEMTINSYIRKYGSFDLPFEHEIFYKDTSLYYDTPDFFFVHAGLNPQRTIKESLKKEKYMQEFLWERSHLYSSETKWEKKVVFGHTPMPEPLVGDKMIGIDTGCVYGSSRGYGILTAVKIPELSFIQKNCIDNI